MTRASWACFNTAVGGERSEETEMILRSVDIIEPGSSQVLELARALMLTPRGSSPGASN